MLVDALRPPDGQTLHTAVGTTFTLDLDALLLATLSFAVFDRLDTEQGRPDPIALLESVRRHTDNLTVFAQAGALSGPRKHPPILTYLEDSVVPVRPARPGYLFHPKVWALKFVDGSGAPNYRLLVLSRNLTFDASWDTILRLDSSPTDRPRQRDAVVADFLDTLPGLAVNAVTQRRTQQLAALSEELRNVAWEKPDKVRSVRFHPLGPDFTAPPMSGNRTLVMSPFLSAATVREHGEAPGDNVLISRAPALDGVGGNAVAGYSETFVIDSGDDLPPVDLGDDQPDDVAEPDDVPALDIDIEPPRAGSELSGLHAKVWVTENDDYTRLWLGSPNATEPAFAGNVEFLVECRYWTDDLTIDALLDHGVPNLRSLLTPYTPAADEPTAVEEAVRDLDRLVRDLSTGSFTVAVGGGETADSWTADLSWPELTAGQQTIVDRLGVDLTIGPATQTAHRLPWHATADRLDNVSLEGITSFLSIEARTSIDGQPILARSLVNAQLTGAPSDRNEQLLSRLLDDPDKVLRYLLFLLAELTGDTTLIDALGGAGANFSWNGSDDDAPPILEGLLRALAHAPESLTRVAEFIGDLRSGGRSELLPGEFDAVWGPIDEVRRSSQ